MAKEHPRKERRNLDRKGASYFGMDSKESSVSRILPVYSDFLTPTAELLVVICFLAAETDVS